MPLLLFFAMLCWCECCGDMSPCGEEAVEGNTMRASLGEIRVKEAHDDEDDELEIRLVVSNQSDTTYCILPSELRLWYDISYRNGESNSVRGGRSTMATGARKVSDLAIDCVVVPPAGTEKILVRWRAHAKPRGVEGSLRFRFEYLSPYQGATYRGVLIYRDQMTIRSEVVVKQIEDAEKQPRRREWVIRPRNDAKGPGKDRETENGRPKTDRKRDIRPKTGHH